MLGKGSVSAVWGRLYESASTSSRPRATMTRADFVSRSVRMSEVEFPDDCVGRVVVLACFPRVAAVRIAFPLDEVGELATGELGVEDALDAVELLAFVNDERRRRLVHTFWMSVWVEAL